MTNIYQLAIAPQLVARTRFSPPPPSSNLCLTIPEALHSLEMEKKRLGGEIGTVLIAGPGDPLATPDITFEAIGSMKEKYPELNIVLHTYGIGSSAMAARLAHAGIHHVEMAVEAVRSEIIERLFAWIRPGSKTLKLREAARLLIKEQSSGVSAMKFHDISVAIVTTLYPGYNMHHVGKISSEMKELGADSIALLPYKPAIGVEVTLESPTAEEVAQAKKLAAPSLPLIEPLYNPYSFNLPVDKAHNKRDFPVFSRERPYVAIVSSNGKEVDLHLGHALQFLIYGLLEDGHTHCVETRRAPEPGSGSDRWLQVADILSDCSLLLTASAGEKPRKILAEQGVQIVVIEKNIKEVLNSLLPINHKNKKLDN